MTATKCKPVVFRWNEVKPFMICDCNGCPHMELKKRVYPGEELVWNSKSGKVTSTQTGLYPPKTS